MIDMMEQKVTIILFLLGLSVLLLVLPCIVAIIRAILRWLDKCEPSSRGYKSKLFAISGFLVFSMWCFKYALCLSDIWLAPSADSISPIEALLHSFLASIHDFGADYNLGSYLSDVKQTVGLIFDGKEGLISLCSYYAAALSVAAPIAGGAIIFEIIASIFPSVQMWLSYFNVFREKYYFSELNENSLSLIKDIERAHKKKIFRPVIIVTDSYFDDESETSVELVNEAKIHGAICVKNDIVHIEKNRFGKRKFFFIDLDENSNVRKLIELSGKMKAKCVKNSEFYPFVSGETFQAIERQVRSNLSASKDVEPVVIPVNSYRNLILNTFSDLPLFEPIVHKRAKSQREDTELNVTVLGSGDIATEMLLGTTWCGQMLGCKLNITVISDESEDDFRKKLDHISPEILRSADPCDPLLRIYRKDEFAPVGAERQSEPYFGLEYVEADFSGEGVTDLDTSERVKNTDYFFVAVGSDDENIMMANKLRQLVGRSHIVSGGDRRTVISYVVFDTNLNRVLNEKKLYSYSGQGNDIYMEAIGSLAQLYSVQNVFLAEFDFKARGSHKKYYSSEETENRRSYSKNMSADSYSHSSSIARIVHRPYRVFSAGLWNSSVFDCKNEGEIDAYEQQKLGYWNNYVNEIVHASREKKTELLHSLAWLEHRRWNAYLRARGFCGPCVSKENGRELDAQGTLDYMKRFLSINNTQKNLELKLHLCLVECSRKGLLAEFDAHGKPSEYAVWNISSDEDYIAVHPDLLDELAIIMSNEAYKPHAKVPRKEFKCYDYPAYEIGRYFNAAEFACETGLDLQSVKKLYDSGELSDVIECDGDVLIPEKNLEIAKAR